VGIDRIDVDRTGPSYAIDTVRALRERFVPQASLIWLMGADSLIKLPTWNSWQELINVVNFAVASRPNYDLQSNISPELSQFLQKHQTLDSAALENSPSGLIYLDEGLSVDLSSTTLRNQLKTSARNAIAVEQIPSRTLQIITDLGLYQ
jgi:nicotinate-nucleotide adenylyltransferase